MPQVVSARASLPARDFARGLAAPGLFFAARGDFCHAPKIGDAERGCLPYAVGGRSSALAYKAPSLAAPHCGHATRFFVRAQPYSVRQRTEVAA